MAETLPCLIDQRCHCFARKVANEFPHLLQLIHCMSMQKVSIAAEVLSSEVRTREQPVSTHLRARALRDMARRM